MGRKGTSKRKPKANSGPAAKANKNESITGLMKGKEAPLSKAGATPGDSGKTQNKR